MRPKVRPVQPPAAAPMGWGWVAGGPHQQSAPRHRPTTTGKSDGGSEWGAGVQAEGGVPCRPGMPPCSTPRAEARIGDSCGRRGRAWRVRAVSVGGGTTHPPATFRPTTQANGSRRMGGERFGKVDKPCWNKVGRSDCTAAGCRRYLQRWWVVVSKWPPRSAGGRGGGQHRVGPRGVPNRARGVRRRFRWDEQHRCGGAEAGS